MSKHNSVQAAYARIDKMLETERQRLPWWRLFARRRNRKEREMFGLKRP